MPQYAILIYEKETPGGVADIPPDVMEANLRAERADRRDGRACRARAGA